MNFQPKLKEVEMKNMVKNICAAMVISLCAAGHLSATENNPNNDNNPLAELSQCILDSSNGSIINVI